MKVASHDKLQLQNIRTIYQVMAKNYLGQVCLLVAGLEKLAEPEKDPVIFVFSTFVLLALVSASTLTIVLPFLKINNVISL